MSIAFDPGDHRADHMVVTVAEVESSVAAMAVRGRVRLAWVKRPG